MGRAARGVAAVGACLLAASAAAPAPSTPEPVASSPVHVGTARCSLQEFAGWRASELAYVLATATGETVRASPASVDYIESDRPGATTRFVGQRFRVERSVGGAAVPRDVILVPWSYEAACRPVAWQGPARWVHPGARVFLQLTPRAPADWVDGVPTYDVMAAAHQAYPGRAVAGISLRWAPEGEALTADELFEVYALLPDETQLADRAAAQAALDWLEARSPDGSVYPVGVLARHLVMAVEHARGRALDPLMAGTWEVELVRGPGSHFLFFARTDDRVTGTRVSRLTSPNDVRALRAIRVEGHELRFWFAPTVAGLPDTHAEASRERRAPGPLLVADSTASLGARAWIDPGYVDGVLRRMTGPYAPDVRLRHGVRADGTELPGAFRRQDGALVFEQPVEVLSGEGATLRWTRVSTAVVGERW